MPDPVPTTRLRPEQLRSHRWFGVDEVKRGVWQAGGFPLEIPVLALPEIVMKPSTMLYRNLLAMETEEVLRSQPFDAAVLMGGCDKTTPGLLMGAFSSSMRCGRPTASKTCWPRPTSWCSPARSPTRPGT